MNWFFIILAVFVILGILAVVLNKPFECPNCGTFNRKYYGRKYLSSRYMHATKSGSADKRYKSNPTIYSYELTLCCKKCNKIYTAYINNQRFLENFTKPIEKSEQIINTQYNNGLTINEIKNNKEEILDNNSNYQIEESKQSTINAENYNSNIKETTKSNIIILSEEEKVLFQNNLINQNKGKYSILLKEIRTIAKLQCVKIIKETLNLDLRTAKSMIDNIPIMIYKGISKTEANKIKKIFEKEEMIVEIIENEKFAF